MPPMSMMKNAGLRLSRRLLGTALLMSAIAAIIAPRARAQWTVVNLHPVGHPEVFNSYLTGIEGGQQVGYVRVQGAVPVTNHAALWSGTPESFVDLHPDGATISSAVSVSNGKQVGTAYFGSVPRPSLWTGTAASWVDLTPPGSSAGSALGASGTQQVGQVGSHAGRWSSTAGSWVDLNPSAATESTAWDTDGTQQVGYVYLSNGGNGNSRASVWNGTAGSWVDLHPSAAFISRAVAVHNGQQVGWGSYTLTQRAHLWTGTANSLVNLHPPGTGQSRCNGVHNGQQVGMASVIVGPSVIEHAALWSGTAASWVDLHTFLPPQFLVSSEAMDIWHSGPYTYVVGHAYNNTTQRYEAIMWINGPACPADINHDGSVNVNDLLAVITGWGPCPQPPAVCSGDVNNDGQVDVNDLLAVITSWGNC